MRILKEPTSEEVEGVPKLLPDEIVEGNSGEHLTVETGAGYGESLSLSPLMSGGTESMSPRINDAAPYSLAASGGGGSQSESSSVGEVGEIMDEYYPGGRNYDHSLSQSAIGPTINDVTKPPRPYPYSSSALSAATTVPIRAASKRQKIKTTKATANDIVRAGKEIRKEKRRAIERGGGSAGSVAGLTVNVPGLVVGAGATHHQNHQQMQQQHNPNSQVFTSNVAPQHLAVGGTVGSASGSTSRYDSSLGLLTKKFTVSD